MTAHPLSRRLRSCWPWLAVLSAVLWQYRAPLLGKVWSFEDISGYFVPLYTVAARAFRAGSLPMWEPGAWSGQPLLSDPQLGVFYPFHWLWLWVGPVTLYAWMTLLHALLGAWAMASLCRHRGASVLASALGSATFVLGAFFVMRLRHAAFTNTAVWLVFALGSLELLRTRPGPSVLSRFALQLALAVLAGGWQLLPYGALVLGVYAVTRSLGASAARARTALGLGLATLLGLGLAAVQLVPTLAHAALSPRALGVGPTLASAYAWPSWRYALTLVVPTLFGDEALGTYAGVPNQWEMCGWGIGLVGTALALFSLQPRAGRGGRAALLGLLLLGCDLARGEAGVFHGLFRHLPVFSSLRGPTRALFVWVLVGPVLAADGLDALRALLASRAPWLRVAAPLLFVLSGAQLLRDGSRANPSVTPAQAEALPEAVAWLRAQRTGGRVATHRYLPRRFHNGLAAWSLENAGGYHSLPIWRYLHLLWITNFRSPYPAAQLEHDLGTHGPWRSASVLLDLLGVEWFVTPNKHPLGAEHFRLALQGSEGIDVWHNGRVLPRAQVLFHSQTVSGPRQSAEALADPRFDPRALVVIEAERPLPTDAPAAPRPALPVTALHRPAPTRLSATVTLPATGVLVLSEPFYPGWRVTVDGAPGRLYPANLALRGVLLGPGVHRVELYFETPGLRAGAALSGVSLLGLLACGVAPRWRRRRLAAR